MSRRVPSQYVCKFLSGAFFVNAGILFYLYLYRVSVPIFSTGLSETPEISGARSIVHAILFLIFFYLVSFESGMRKRLASDILLTLAIVVDLEPGGAVACNPRAGGRVRGRIRRCSSAGRR